MIGLTNTIHSRRIHNNFLHPTKELPKWTRQLSSPAVNWVGLYFRSRKLQLRWEIYNVFNRTPFATVDAVARFDPAGNQVNTRFGQAITTRTPRVMQVALRFVF